MKAKYQAILYEKAPVSKKHRPMSLHDRAAQFAPFKALTGYDEEIGDSSKYREERRLLSSEQIEELDLKLKEIAFKKIEEVTICYFKQDGLQKGNYLIKQVKIKDFDLLKQQLVTSDAIIPFEDIYEIEIP